MALEPPLPAGVLDELRRLDSCSVSDAIETFEIRLRNTGFADAGIRCMFEDFPPVVGYAATARLRSSEPPMIGAFYHERHEWWNNILQVPEPRIAVLEDVDEPPGIGALLGDMQAAILRALGCAGYVTNGSVRELPQVRDLGLQLFAGNVAVSHAYAHIFEYGSPVHVGGLEVRQGDLLHGDRHGVLSVPNAFASRIPEAARRLRRHEQSVIEFCKSERFSVEELPRVLKEPI